MALAVVGTINMLSTVLVLIVVVDSILTYFVSPSHPLRSALDRVVQPLLTPIRRILPLVGMFDFSPLVLILLIQLVAYLLVRVFYFIL